MGFIEREYFLPRITKIRSKEKRDNHITMICHVNDKKAQEVVQKEMKKAIHRMNRLLENGVSYEGEIILEKDGLKI